MDVTEFERSYQEGDEQSDNQQDGDSEQSAKEASSSSEWRISDTTRQGPLGSGDFLHIGTFSEVIERMARRNGISLDGHWPSNEQLKFQRLTLSIIGIYGSEDHPIGVERAFRLHDTEWRMCAGTGALGFQSPVITPSASQVAQASESHQWGRHQRAVYLPASE